jgi:hypothetical protein
MLTTPGQAQEPAAGPGADHRGEEGVDGVRARPRQGLAVSPVRARASWVLGPLNACTSAPDLAAEVESLLERPVFARGRELAAVALEVRVRPRAPGDTDEARPADDPESTEGAAAGSSEPAPAAPTPGWELSVRTRVPGEPDGSRRLTLGPVACGEARRSLAEVLALALDYRVPALPEDQAVERASGALPNVTPAAGAPGDDASDDRWLPGVGAVAAVAFGLLPDPAWGLGGSVDLLARGGDLGGWSIAFAGMAWLDAPASAGAGGAQVRGSFSAWSLQLGVCRRALLPGGTLGLEGCLAGVAGRVDGTVRGPELGGAFDGSWVGGPELGLGLLLVDLGPFEARLLGTLLANVAPRTFASGCAAGSDCGVPRLVLHAQSVIVPGLSLGLRWRIDS